MLHDCSSSNYDDDNDNDNDDNDDDDDDSTWPSDHDPNPILSYYINIIVLKVVGLT